MAQHRQLRGPVVAAVVALPHRHERVPRHARRARSVGRARWISGRRRRADTVARRPVCPRARWIQPVPDARVLPEDGDPAELAESRETIRLAFVAALQHLPPKQRAVLILREVLRWQAQRGRRAARHERRVGEQRPRSGPGPRSTPPTSTRLKPLQFDEEQQELLARYVDAFERYDITSLVELLHEDATFTMPPFALWLEGPVEIGKWYLGQGIGCRGSRLVPTSANGCPAFASYKPAPDGNGWEPFNLQVVEVVRRPDLGAPPLPLPRAVRRLRAPAPPRAVGRRPGPRARSAHGAPRWRCGARSSSPRDVPRAGGAPGRPPCTRSGAVESTSITIGFGASRATTPQQTAPAPPEVIAPSRPTGVSGGSYTPFVDASWWGSDEFRRDRTVGVATVFAVLSKEPPVPKRDEAPIGAPCWVDLLDLRPGRQPGVLRRAVRLDVRGAGSRTTAATSTSTRTASRRRLHDATTVSPVRPTCGRVYLATDDAETTVAAAAANGGEVIVPGHGRHGPRQDGGRRRRRSARRSACGSPAGTGASASSPSPARRRWFELHTRDYDASVALLPGRVQVGRRTSRATRPSSATRRSARATTRSPASWTPPRSCPRACPRTGRSTSASRTPTPRSPRSSSSAARSSCPQKTRRTGAWPQAADPTGALFKLVAG